jgi:hypothetical protein
VGTAALRGLRFAGAGLAGFTAWEGSAASAGFTGTISVGGVVSAWAVPGCRPFSSEVVAEVAASGGVATSDGVAAEGEVLGGGVAFVAGADLLGTALLRDAGVALPGAALGFVPEGGVAAVPSTGGFDSLEAAGDCDSLEAVGGFEEEGVSPVPLDGVALAEGRADAALDGAALDARWGAAGFCDVTSAAGWAVTGPSGPASAGGLTRPGAAFLAGWSTFSAGWSGT